ncbi:hypothetical protein D9619_012059 [Psilocybe cf. subviscida]|uniref:Uncharacterized protein n=1 Tax=Psilocybe cf. subviscida TaxID=2480587 RepID=A0A8H5B7G1_9AGAR|nr:hypothetical protein D9619_012059 [Psilocybe cf. subviscida]
MSSASNPGGPPSGPSPPPTGPSSPSPSPSKSSTPPPPPPSSTDPPPPTGPTSSSTPPSTSATETSSAAPTSTSAPPPTTAAPTTPTPTPTPTPRPITTPTTRPTSTHSQGVVTQVSTQFVSPTLGATANADHNRSSKGPPVRASTPCYVPDGRVYYCSAPNAQLHSTFAQAQLTFWSISFPFCKRHYFSLARDGWRWFFDNTGAVAGVFSVVGLIGLAIIIALIANTIRRRRARKFDKELAAATLEAASAPKPVFLDDDEDEHGGYGSNANSGYGGGAHGGGGYGAFSDASSHGTYSQQPMSIGQGQESYGMRELQHHAPVQPGELFDPYAAGAMAGAGAAGAAGIGVARARSHRALQDGGAGGSYGAGLQEGGAPYAAFAAPGHQQPPHMPVQEYGGRNPNLDVMEAAGLGAHVAGAGALARNQSKSVSPASTPAQDAYGPGQGLERNKSLGSYDAYAAYPAAVQQQQPQAYYNSAASPPPGGQAQMYGGYSQQQSYQSQSHQQSSSSSYQQHSSSYQTQQQQQASHTRGYSDAGVEEDDAYGGYVVEDEPPSPSHHPHTTAATTSAKPALLTPGTAGSRSPGSDALPNPFERPMASSQGHGGYAEYDERDRASSDDGDTDAEPPRRVLKVANE